MYNDFRINIQLFADEEKTEKPTPKKRKEAREEGQVVKSKEINTAFMLLLVFLGLKIFGDRIYKNIMNFFNFIFSQYNNGSDFFTIKGIHTLFIKTIIVTAEILAPILIISFITALLVNYFQVGFLFSVKSLKPKLSKINPIEGFKRIFSPNSLIELIKSLIKIFIVGYVVLNYIKDKINSIYSIIDMNLQSAVVYIGDIAFGIAIRASGVFVLIAIMDYLFQWYRHEKKLKMSKHEVKQENKQSEGDPQIKSKIKEKQRQMAMTRMMQDVPDADVIITNPTHYAIAIKYDSDEFDAPLVIAKGKDLIAQNIRSFASQKF
ncbi:flagellar biosynthesis protein FlhB [Dethiothermospora halolimnae]|uniref:flagellar biosynthesis protein FlhB n=1 Tax=Dethiothermospora halolimnae TaxID=3114390 RepID=UPI003CCBB39A